MPIRKYFMHWFKGEKYECKKCGLTFTFRDVNKHWVCTNCGKPINVLIKTVSRKTKERWLLVLNRVSPSAIMIGDKMIDGRILRPRKIVGYKKEDTGYYVGIEKVGSYPRIKKMEFINKVVSRKKR
jgi:hypothetical protein